MSTDKTPSYDQREREIAADESVPQPTERANRSTTHKWIGYLTLVGAPIVMVIIMASSGNSAWLFPAVGLALGAFCWVVAGYWIAWRPNRHVDPPRKKK